jgi:hypothetical protein
MSVSAGAHKGNRILFVEIFWIAIEDMWVSTVYIVCVASDDANEGDVMNAVCIKCWDVSALVTMDLDGSREFVCTGCEERFTCDEVNECLAAMQKGWAKLIKWAESYPADETKAA